MQIDELVKEAQGLPEELIMSAVSYLKFLKFTAENAETPAVHGKKKRKAGILKGKMTIPASFDDPIEGFKDYM